MFVGVTSILPLRKKYNNASGDIISITIHPSLLGIIGPQLVLENFPYGAGILRRVMKVKNPKPSQAKTSDSKFCNIDNNL